MTARNISLLNATYSDVPAVQLPISGGGTATFTEVTDTTATASDVATGKYFYTSAGVKTQGTNSGGSSVSVGTSMAEPYGTGGISFTGLLGVPTSFVVTSLGDIPATYSVPTIAGIVFDGTDFHIQTITNTSNSNVSYYSSGVTPSYSNGTMTLYASGMEYAETEYKLVYTYNGSSSDIHTADVQVGSGATSITFSSLSGRPIYWSCIFKSDFSTSSGYQRVIEVVNDGTSIYGMAMDSSAHAQTSWTATYSGGNLTISSSGTNNGGYFHQPGYYQLTYAVDDSAPVYQTKTVSPTTSQQTVTADNGYDALEEVIVNAMPTMALPSATSATSSGTSKATITPSSSVQYLNIPTGYNGTAQHYTISASGGGESKNVQAVQGTTRTTSSTLTAIGAELTVSKTGTYDVYWSGVRTTTSGSYTYGTQLYINGTAHGTQNTTWSNHVQNNHLSNVSLTQGQKLRVYGRNSRGSSYYIYAPTLLIIEE